MDKTSSDILDESSEWSAAVITASGFVLRGDQRRLVLRFLEAVGPVSVDFDEIERCQSSPNGEAVYLSIWWHQWTKIRFCLLESLSCR